MDREIIYQKSTAMYQYAKREGVMIMNTHAARHLEIMSKCFKWVGRGLVVFNVVKDAKEIRAAYQKHGHWIKLAVEDSLKIAAGVGVGIIVASLFTGGGWVVVLAAGATDATLNAGFGNLIDSLGDAFDPS